LALLRGGRVAPDLGVDGLTEPEPLVSELRHQFGLEIVVWCVDAPYGFQETEGYERIDRRGHNKRLGLVKDKREGKRLLNHVQARSRGRSTCRRLIDAAAPPAQPTPAIELALSFFRMTLVHPAVLRAAAGLVLAAVVARLAARARALNTSGAIAAAFVGAACVAAGWDWAALLMLFFISSTLLSRLGRGAKERRTDAVVAKGGPRDAVQVMANGAVFAICAAGYALWPSEGWQALAIGALAAATADTWATEIGTLMGQSPRSIISLRVVTAGTSGGVTLPGTLASVAGAALIGVAARLAGWPPIVAWWAVAAGVAGAIADSIMGAVWQSRRRCPACNILTERRVHPCGTVTMPAGGVAWLDNDAVNALSTVCGALVCWIGVRTMGVA
jgi:uncharacterized protein (TIGR00297 family)